MRAPARAICLFSGALVLCAAGCAGNSPRTTATFNQGAALVGELPMNPLAWRVISSAVDAGSGTMSTLFGNDVAVAYARTHTQHDYPSGSVLSFVTWTQAEDPRWFGAKIPSQVKSVEFVTVGGGGNGQDQYSYQGVHGQSTKKTADRPLGVPPERIAYFLSIRRR